MRVAALYDIHGNLPALEAVLAELETMDVDRIVVGGDVLFGPLQSECVTALRALDAVFVSGNCEQDVLAAANKTCEWCRERLTDAEVEVVSGWPIAVEIGVDGLGSVLFCHATPRRDNENLTRSMPDSDVAEALADVTADVVVCGHTHVQYDRDVSGGPRVVNAGSVGLPYQGEAGAFWALLDDDVELRRTSYDAESALSALVSTGFPEVEEIFADSIRGTASAESATAYFESRRLARG